jgi:hypothetical protein
MISLNRVRDLVSKHERELLIEALDIAEHHYQRLGLSDVPVVCSHDIRSDYLDRSSAFLALKKLIEVKY